MRVWQMAVDLINTEESRVSTETMVTERSCRLFTFTKIFLLSLSMVVRVWYGAGRTMPQWRRMSDSPRPAQRSRSLSAIASSCDRCLHCKPLALLRSNGILMLLLSCSTAARHRWRPYRARFCARWVTDARAACICV